MSDQNQLSDLLNILSYLNNALQNNHLRSLNQNCRVYCSKYNSNKEVMITLEELQDTVDQFTHDINKAKSQLMKGIKL